MNSLALFPNPCSGQKRALNIQRAHPRPRKGWEEVQKPRKGPEDALSPEKAGKRTRSLENPQKRPRGPEKAGPERGGKRSRSLEPENALRPRKGWPGKRSEAQTTIIGWGPNPIYEL